MSNSLNQSSSDNGPPKSNKFVTRIVDNIIESVNSEPNDANTEKTNHSQTSEKSSVNNWRDEEKKERRAAAPISVTTAKTHQNWPSDESLNRNVSEIQTQLVLIAQRLEALEKAPPSVRVPDNDLGSAIESLQLRVAKLQGTSRVQDERIEAIQQQSYQTEQQRQYDRIDESKRQQARERQTEERLKNHFYTAVRPIVEEIIPQRNRSRFSDAAKPPMNPPMPSQHQPSRVEAIAGIVPRLVLYGLMAIISCLSVVFLLNPGFLYNLVQPTQTSLSILLSIIIVSGGVILLANSWE